WAFEAFRHDSKNSRSLSHDSVYAVLEDKDGTLWVGTQQGLNRFDRATRSFETVIPSQYVTALVEDIDGALWIATFGGGLLHRDRATGVIRSLRHDAADPRSIRSDRILSLCRDPEGNLWVGTFNGLDRMEASTGTFRHVAIPSDGPVGVDG